jgi:hypothetical protein
MGQGLKLCDQLRIPTSFSHAGQSPADAKSYLFRLVVKRKAKSQTRPNASQTKTILKTRHLEGKVNKK